MINSELKEYLDSVVLPHYKNYDKGHSVDHITEVARESLELASLRDVNKDMVYTAAIFHDLGLVEGREFHHLASGRMLREDSYISKYFSAEEVEIIAEAIEDHRASAKSAPRSIYGEILSSADRLIDADTIITRSFYHSEKHYPDYSTEQHIERIHNHVQSKYSENGYLRIPILTQRNAEGLARLRSLLAKSEDFKQYAATLIATIKRGLLYKHDSTQGGSSQRQNVCYRVPTSLH